MTELPFVGQTHWGGQLNEAIKERDKDVVEEVTRQVGDPTTPIGTSLMGTIATRAVEVAMPRVGNDLATIDLNSVTAPGVYRQHVTAAATTERNYPAQFGGVLHVDQRGPTNANGVLQTYRPFGGTVKEWTRFTPDGTTWTPWNGFVTQSDLTGLTKNSELPARVAAEVRKPETIAQADLLTTTTAAATFSDIGWAEGVRQKEDKIRRGKFGKIGTSGKAVIALRIDHQLDEYRAKVAPLFEARGLPAGIGLVTQSVGQPTGGPTGYEPTTTTWQQVHEQVFYKGCEIWSHSRTHGNGPDGRAGLVSEIVGSQADIAAQGLLCMGWQQPGGPSTYGVGHTSAEAMDDEAGSLIRQTYPLYESWLTGTTMRMLPTDGCRGHNHITVEAVTVQFVKDYIDRAIRLTAGLEIMCHPNQLDIPGLMSTAGFAAVLDYIVQKRDEGLIEVLTPSGLAYADPTSTHRPSLITGGDFPSPTPTPEWTLGTATIGTDGGKNGPNYLRAPAGVVANYALMGANGFGIQGHVFYFQGWARALSGGTWRVRAISSNAGGGGSKYPLEKTGTAGPDWTFVRVPFGVPLDVGNLYFAVGSSAGQIDWDHVEVVAA